jgi:hypothetical protein
MTYTPHLGTTPEEALRSAYSYGYSYFKMNDPEDFIDPDDLDTDIETAIEELGLFHFESVRVAVTESQANKRLWWALEDFYEEHLPLQYPQFKREAAVAEDYDTAFQAGASAAILGEERDPEGDLSFLLGE